MASAANAFRGAAEAKEGRRIYVSRERCKQQQVVGVPCIMGNEGGLVDADVMMDELVPRVGTPALF